MEQTQTIECCVRYARLLPDGFTADVRETWLVEARGYGDAQSLVKTELAQYAQDGARCVFITQMKLVNYFETIEDTEAAKQRWWRAVVRVTSTNADTVKQSHTNQPWLIRADTMRRAQAVAEAAMDSTCEIVKLNETKYKGYMR